MINNWTTRSRGNNLTQYDWRTFTKMSVLHISNVFSNIRVFTWSVRKVYQLQHRIRKYYMQYCIFFTSILNITIILKIQLNISLSFSCWNIALFHYKFGLPSWFINHPDGSGSPRSHFKGAASRNRIHDTARCRLLLKQLGQRLLNNIITAKIEWWVTFFSSETRFFFQEIWRNLKKYEYIWENANFQKMRFFLVRNGRDWAPTPQTCSRTLLFAGNMGPCVHWHNL